MSKIIKLGSKFTVFKLCTNPTTQHIFLRNELSYFTSRCKPSMQASSPERQLLSIRRKVTTLLNKQTENLSF